MAKIEVAPDLIQIFEHAADALNIETYPQQTVDDFKPGDAVQCSLLKGIYVVDTIGIKTNRLFLRALEDTELYPNETWPVKPKYVKKLDKNSKAFKTLFTKA